MTLDCGRPVPEDVSRIGVRARHIRVVKPGTSNAFFCRVERVIEDVSSMIVLLRPEKSRPGAPLLQMELDKAVWQSVPNRERLHVSIDPENILFLRKE